MKTVLFIITGGIAAYKSLLTIRLLRQAGFEVLPVMTASAHEFVTPLSVAALAENPVRDQLFNLDEEAKMGHIELARAAALVLIAPATANFMAKIANGHADDLASTLVLATRSPLLFAPAMNVAMWENPATRQTLQTLQDRGATIIPPGEGAMACGEFGEGRLAEPEEIYKAVEAILGARPLKDKHILLSSGPTHEPIDPVRYIANRSSGKQGTAIAEALIDAGAKVTFVTGPAITPPPKGAQIIKVETAQQMQTALHQALPADVFISAAAVADWRVENSSDEKIKKTTGGLPELSFAQNPDILAEISNLKTNRPPLVIGFAAETQNVEEYASAKRKRKGCDWIIANDVSPQTGIMGGDENEIYLIKETGSEHWPRQSKTAAARSLVNAIIQHFESAQ